MEPKSQIFMFLNDDLLNVEGQIIKLLLINERSAGDIYENCRASPSTVSRKISRMVDQGKLDCRISKSDRRVPIYSISENYRRALKIEEIADDTGAALI